MQKKNKWYFPARLIKVVDGDTLKLVVDIGFRITMIDNFRLARIDAPEPRGSHRDAGLKAKEYLESILSKPTLLKIETMKHGKYRWVIEAWLPDGRNISDEMVASGHAVFREF